MSFEIVVGLIGLILGSGGLGAFALSRAQARKTQAETSVLMASEEWKRLTEVSMRYKRRISAVSENRGSGEERYKNAIEVNRLRLGVVVLIKSATTIRDKPRVDSVVVTLFLLIGDGTVFCCFRVVDAQEYRVLVKEMIEKPFRCIYAELCTRVTVPEVLSKEEW
jgi:hypothetical protein